MKLKETTTLSEKEKQEITTLWNTVFPATLGFENINAFDVFFAGVENVMFALAINSADRLVGCFIAFWRNNQQFFSILIADEAQGKGLGTQLLQQAKEKHQELNGWMVDVAGYKRKDGSAYQSPEAFYIKHGFEILKTDRWDNEKVKSVKIRWRR